MEELSNFFKEGRHLVNMKLVKSDKLLQNNSEVAGELNNFFKETVLTLNIKDTLMQI